MRPQIVDLNLLTIKFPITAYASILHRLSGLLLFIMIPFFLSLVNDILFNTEGFTHTLKSITNSYIALIILWLSLSALVYHLLAGIRHLAMDAGMGESKNIARFTAGFVITLSAAISLILGIRLC